MATVIDQAKEQMKKSVEATKENFAGIRTGRANPALLNGITVDYYGSPTPLKAVASIGVPEPRIEAYAEYRNIAGEASSVTATEGTLAEGSTLAPLNDGLLSVQRDGLAAGTREFADTYIKETQITATSTFTFNFEEGRTVRAVLVYTSKNASDIFYTIPEMRFTGTDEAGNSVSYVVRNVELSKDFYTYLEGRDIVTYLNVGAFAFAEFNELSNITSVSITVEKPEGQTLAGISEIRILGK